MVCTSPKSCFRAAFQADLLDEAETTKALEMTDDRNLTVHAYHEATAQKIFERLPGYRNLLGKTPRPNPPRELTEGRSGERPTAEGSRAAVI